MVDKPVKEKINVYYSAHMVWVWEEDGIFYRWGGFGIKTLDQEDSNDGYGNALNPTLFFDRRAFNSWFRMMELCSTPRTLAITEALTQNPLNGFFTIADEYLETFCKPIVTEKWQVVSKAWIDRCLCTPTRYQGSPPGWVMRDFIRANGGVPDRFRFTEGATPSEFYETSSEYAMINALELARGNYTYPGRKPFGYKKKTKRRPRTAPLDLNLNS